MAKILVLLILLVAVLGVGDVEARIFAQHQLEQRIDSRVTSAGAHVSISSFPFLGRLVTSGTVQKITAHVVQVRSGLFTFDSIDVTVTGVKLDRHGLLNDQRVVVKGIDRGTIVGDMSQAAVDHALSGLPVKLGDGVAQLTVAGVTVTTQVSIVHNVLHFNAAGIPATLALPTLPLLPCPLDATVTPGRLRLTCIVTKIPSVFLTTAAAQVGA